MVSATSAEYRFTSWGIEASWNKNASSGQDRIVESSRGFQVYSHNLGKIDHRSSFRFDGNKGAHRERKKKLRMDGRENLFDIAGASHDPPSALICIPYISFLLFTKIFDFSTCRIF